jgi:hypothetical protein
MIEELPTRYHVAWDVNDSGRIVGRFVQSQPTMHHVDGILGRQPRTMEFVKLWKAANDKE